MQTDVQGGELYRSSPKTTPYIDLANSGLIPSDIKLRPLTQTELAATNLPTNLTVDDGYVIPYFDINGVPVPYYRVKVLNGLIDARYKQPKGSVNHVYFPPGFGKVLRAHIESVAARAVSAGVGHLNGQMPVSHRPFIVITEGEKKSAAGCKSGLPCVGLSGVDSWRIRTITLPSDSSLKTGNKLGPDGKPEGGKIQVRLPQGTNNLPETSTYAEGFQKLVDLIQQLNLTVVLLFDTDAYNDDSKRVLKDEVQRAVAMLGYALRHEGIATTRIRHVILPRMGVAKVGLDDYLQHPEGGTARLGRLIEWTLALKTGFPRHPNPRLLISNKLDSKMLSRRESQEIAHIVTAELDFRGQRLKSLSDGTPYFFDHHSFKLLPANILGKPGEPFPESPFGEYLYREFGLSTADNRILVWLASQFTGEDPVEVVEPRRVCCIDPKNGDQVAIQLSDGQFALVGADMGYVGRGSRLGELDVPIPIKILTNGQGGLLFEQDHVDPVNVVLLQEHIKKELQGYEARGFMHCWWLDAVNDTSIVGDRNKQIAALLCYVSPYLNRWRNSQLPVECYYGEPGSGKSSLYELRMQVLSGRPVLRNIPTDIRDWFAGITNTGGLYVTDNVQFADKALRQKLSDEVCRIITEPNPHVEMRKLYTTSSQMRAPVRIVFGFTAIHMPFQNADFIQRAALFEFHAHNRPDGGWVESQMTARGGREAWLAHNLVALHLFLRKAVSENKWTATDPTTHRLSFYEQNLKLMASIFDLEVDWIGSTLDAVAQDVMTEMDWTLEALKEFSLECGATYHRFNTKVISDWAQMSGEYTDNSLVSNARRLGKYMQAHRQAIGKVAGIQEAGMEGNRMTYSVQKSFLERNGIGVLPGPN